jgi:hypothetical protein
MSRKRIGMFPEIGLEGALRFRIGQPEMPHRQLRFRDSETRFANSEIVIGEQGIDFIESLEAIRIREINNLKPLCEPTYPPDYPPMAAGTRNVRIFLSEQCFDLLVDSMAAFSKETRRFQTMRMTVQAACTRLKSYGISKGELEEFMAGYPIDGDVRVFLEVSPEWAQAYDELRARVKEISGKSGSDKVLVPFSVYLAGKHNLL